MRIWVISLWSLFLICLPAAAVQKNDVVVDKYRGISNCLKIVDTVLSGALNSTVDNDLDSQEVRKIEKQISTITNLDDLMLLSGLFQRTYAGLGDLEYRSLYLRVQRGDYTVAKFIAKKPGKEPLDALRNIRAYYKNNATTSLAIDKLIHEQIMKSAQCSGTAVPAKN